MNFSRLKKYSRAKFGELEVNYYFAKKISKLISKKILIKKEKCVLYYTKRYPRIPEYTNNTEILANAVSKILKFPCIIGEYKSKYNKSKFYDNHIKRKLEAPPKIDSKIKKKYKDYTVIMIDDSIITGTVFKASLNELNSMTKDIYLFVISDLKNEKYKEKEVNKLYFSINGTDYLIQLLNSKKPIISGQLLRVIDDLTKQELDYLLQNVPLKTKKLLKKAFFHYIGRKLY